MHRYIGIATPFISEWAHRLTGICNLCSALSLRYRILSYCTIDFLFRKLLSSKNGQKKTSKSFEETWRLDSKHFSFTNFLYPLKETKNTSSILSLVHPIFQKCYSDNSFLEPLHQNISLPVH